MAPFTLPQLPTVRPAKSANVAPTTPRQHSSPITDKHKASQVHRCSYFIWRIHTLQANVKPSCGESVPSEAASITAAEADVAQQHVVSPAKQQPTTWAGVVEKSKVASGDTATKAATAKPKCAATADRPPLVR